MLHTIHATDGPTLSGDNAGLTLTPEKREAIMAEARRMQSEVLGRMVRMAGARVASALRAGLIAPVVRWTRRRRTINELRELDDRMLADIGITRGDISLVIAGGDTSAAETDYPQRVRCATLQPASPRRRRRSSVAWRSTSRLAKSIATPYRRSAPSKLTLPSITS